MTDFSSMSDEELKAWKPVAAPAAPDFTNMSDEDLKAWKAGQAGGKETFYDRLVGNAVDEQGHRYGLGAQLRDMAHGMPIVNHFVSETPESKGFAEAFPGPSKLNQIGASTIAAAPAFAMAPGLGGAMAVGGGINAADSALAGDSPDKVLHNAGWGAAGGAGGYGAGKLLGNVITPYVISPAQKAIADFLESRGIKLTAGQKVGSSKLMQKESVYSDVTGSGTSSEDVFGKPAEEFTHAVKKEFGGTGLATPESLASDGERIGQTFETVGGRNTLKASPTYPDELKAIHAEYIDNQPAGSVVPAVQKAVDDITGALAKNGGVMDGTQYNNFRSVLSRKSASQEDPATRLALGKITNSLDNQMEQSIAASNPADSGKLTEARRQWRNWLIATDAAASSGAMAGKGIITPQALAQSSRKFYGRQGFATGQGDYSTLAKAGQAGMPNISNSGTQSRLDVKGLSDLASVVGGADAGGGGFAAIPGAAAGYGTAMLKNALIARALLGPGQTYLPNQVLSPQAKEMLKVLGSGAGTAEAPQQKY